MKIYRTCYEFQVYHEQVTLSNFRAVFPGFHIMPIIVRAQQT